MPLNPKDTAAYNDSIHSEQLENLFKHVDEYLSHNWYTGRRSITVGIESVSVKVLTIAVARYETEGWRVTSRSEQRDGMSMTFEA